MSGVRRSDGARVRIVGDHPHRGESGTVRDDKPMRFGMWEVDLDPVPTERQVASPDLRTCARSAFRRTRMPEHLGESEASDRPHYWIEFTQDVSSDSMGQSATSVASLRAVEARLKRYRWVCAQLGADGLGAWRHRARRPMVASLGDAAYCNYCGADRGQPCPGLSARELVLRRLDDAFDQAVRLVRWAEEEETPQVASPLGPPRLTFQPNHYGAYTGAT